MASFTITCPADQVAGITAAREAYNAGLPEGSTLLDNAAYLQFVMGNAIQSYCRGFGIAFAEGEVELPEFMAISPTALRLTLIEAGIMPAQVDAAIAAIPDEIERARSSTMWEYATEYHRDHPLIEQLGAAFGLTPAAIDALWRQAQAL